jgi:hypothetical protein
MSSAATREQLTHAARTAAWQGRWDVVRDCYRRREQALAESPVSTEEAARLMAADREIEAQARLAQTALAALMRDTAALRQRLTGLRRGQGVRSSESRMVVEA